ncbi:MAG: OmpA family protein [Methylocystaceae bacterium]|nr:OmpA family protein [Methylocystaceae bacterium]
MGKMAGFRKVLMVSVATYGLMVAADAKAQVATLYDNNVMVDLSVLEDNGVGGVHSSIAAPQNMGKMPPKTMPKSTFYGLPSNAPTSTQMTSPQMPIPGQEPTSRIVLKKPSLPTKQLAESKSVNLKKPAAPQVAAATKPAPKPVAVAKAPEAPKPVEKAPEPPKPAAAPATPVEVVKAEPAPTPAAPAPKEMVKRDETVKEITPPPAPADAPTPAPAAPKVMADAPPPPPPSVVEPKEVQSAIKEEVKKATTTASLPSASESSLRVAFQSGQSKMPSSAEAELKQLAETLRAQSDDRVQLLAYAGGDDLSASKARRLSLSRALAVRSYLIGQGIRSTRIDVRALGNKTTEEPFDRVDVQIAPR